MFCPNCGKEAASGTKFCVGCGTKLEEYVAPQPQSVRAETRQYNTNTFNISSITLNKSTYFFVSISITILTGILLFTEWIELSAGFGLGRGFSLLQFGNIADSVKSLAGREFPGMASFILFLFFALLIISLILLVMFTFKLLTDYKDAGRWGDHAMLSVIALVVFFLIGLFFLNSSLRSAIGTGFNGSLFKATFMPYFVGALAVFGKFYAVRGVHNDAYYQRTNSGSSSGLSSSYSYRLVKCVKCGEQYDKDRVVCPKCSHKNEAMDIKYWTCSKCGESKNPEGKFLCRGCGSVK